MSYVSRIIQPGEQVLAVGRMHWIIFLQGAIVVVAAVALYVAPGEFPIVKFAAIALGLLGALALIKAWLDRWTTEIAVTSHRVIQKRGLIWRETGEMNMQKVESVVVNQSILGRMLNYGTVSVRGTGSGIEGLAYIADPLALRGAISIH